MSRVDDPRYAACHSPYPGAVVPTSVDRRGVRRSRPRLQGLCHRRTASCFWAGQTATEGRLVRPSRNGVLHG
eukprot:2325038-Alexandrium_andersonii.AAC.1